MNIIVIVMLNTYSMCICVFTVQSTHTEPMNFIAKDNNIYYPLESLVKVYAIALSVQL